MLRTILLDDEPQSVALLKHLAAHHCPEVEIIGAYTDSLEGLAAIRHNQPDLVFLDIEMPKLNGFEVLNQCRPVNFKIIFTTAYNQYAVRAFKYSALDYLLKPISEEDLVAAVKKAAQSQVLPEIRQYDVLQQFNPLRQTQPQKMVIPTLEGLIFIEITDIVHCDSDGSYTRIWLSNSDPLLVSKSLKEVEEMLHFDFFYRAHHSHLINLHHIKKFVRADGDVLMSNGRSVPVARSKRQEFIDIVTR
ncbi:MAG: response regulator transcription factor [Saprospiraceae bacterium]|nr:response regulator transcription factor [Saprospiraceae bacterium]